MQMVGQLLRVGQPFAVGRPLDAELRALVIIRVDLHGVPVAMSTYHRFSRLSLNAILVESGDQTGE
jgi:hypothetical protein